MKQEQVTYCRSESCTYKILIFLLKGSIEINVAILNFSKPNGSLYTKGITGIVVIQLVANYPQWCRRIVKRHSFELDLLVIHWTILTESNDPYSQANIWTTLTRCKYELLLFLHSLLNLQHFSQSCLPRILMPWWGVLGLQQCLRMLYVSK